MLHRIPQSVSYQKNPSSSGYDEQEPGITVSDSDREFELRVSSPPVLKRLRRGINTEKCSAKDDRGVAIEVLDCKDDRDDDIEEFSSPEDFSNGFLCNCVLPSNLNEIKVKRVGKDGKLLDGENNNNNKKKKKKKKARSQSGPLASSSSPSPKSDNTPSHTRSISTDMPDQDSWFLFEVMSSAIDKAMMAMSIKEEDKSSEIPDLP